MRFRHPLVRSAIRQAASAAQRHASHAALAEVLAGQPERQVRHRAAASVGGDEEVAGELEQAAARAQRRGDIVAAVAALERAAVVGADRGRRAGRLLRAAELAVELGRRDLVERLVRDAEALDLGALERVRIVWIREMTEPAIPGEAARELLLEAAERARAEGDRDLALNLLWVVASRSWWSDPGKEARMRVVAAADRCGGIDDDLRLLAILAYAAPAERGSLVLDRLRRSQSGDAGAARLLGSAGVVIGAFDLAATHLAAAAADLRAQGRLGHLARILTLRAWAGTFLGDWTAALPAAEEARRLAVETREPLWVAGAQLVKAMLAGLRGEHDDAEAFAAEAEQAVLPIGAGFMLAGLQLARGVSALGAGRHGDACEQLLCVFDPADPAHHPFMSRWAIGDLAEAAVHSGQRERARQELRASGETSRRRTAEARDELTPQELQIAQLAAEGLSNRQIGETFFLSHRTVGSHLYRIFPKLGISSRSELRGRLT